MWNERSQKPLVEDERKILSTERRNFACQNLVKHSAAFALLLCVVWITKQAEIGNSRMLFRVNRVWGWRILRNKNKK